MSTVVRWAAVEAVQRCPEGSRLWRVRQQVESRRGRNIAIVAAARQLVDRANERGGLDNATAVVLFFD